jgi:hypothetical protein
MLRTRMLERDRVAFFTCRFHSERIGKWMLGVNVVSGGFMAFPLRGFRDDGRLAGLVLRAKRMYLRRGKCWRWTHDRHAPQTRHVTRLCRLSVLTRLALVKPFRYR